MMMAVKMVMVMTWEGLVVGGDDGDVNHILIQNVSLTCVFFSKTFCFSEPC